MRTRPTIDTRQRDRFGRVVTSLAYNTFAVGIGLDEDTTVFIGPRQYARKWPAPTA